MEENRNQQPPVQPTPPLRRAKTCDDIWEGMKELYQLLAETKEIQKQNNKYLKSISTAVSIIAVIFVIAAAFAAYYGISLQMILNRF
jgi:hypothetical protein